ncbi:sulfite exporter TauE/SafE family protein [Colwellia sp. UCD-KL20]|uniref:sulfite exporter TauE/SafE family protein n=1 Tax=Colwellia sp. UCD-KL20 TaxID=1917165 RepID=UPI0009704F1E|nr:sulfite exporter TauE/SafE family protein [Colwellia sp. UCD-KL20]
MDFFIISLVAMAASLLTLFSGFGLGTLLMPIVALFFPIEIAVTITAIVHFANNAFKIFLVGKHADLAVILKFGLPAVICALLGALLLTNMSGTHELVNYQILSYEFTTSVMKLVVGGLILFLVVVELMPFFKSLAIDKKYLPLGGMISGFLGGLSGHQGAFRSMFLLKVGLSKEQFVATGVILAVLVDINRLAVYGWHFGSSENIVNWWLVLSACLSAFIGAYFGKKLLTKVTIDTVQHFVSVLLVFIGLGLILGKI